MNCCFFSPARLSHCCSAGLCLGESRDEGAVDAIRGNPSAFCTVTYSEMRIFAKIVCKMIVLEKCADT